MPVYKRPGSDTYSYDFRHGGRRFSGSTGCKKKRDAERFEEGVRDGAKADRLDTTKPLTMADVAFLYWQEIGQHHSDPSGPERNLAWLQAEIGPRTLVSDISNAMVARLVTKRRSDDVKNGTVNRTVVEPLRAILRRAKNVWSASVQEIDWKTHKLKEPQERVREASHVEEKTLLEAIPEDYRPLLTFAILTGCRRGEIVGMRWKDVNFFAREFTVTGKGDRTRTIPMTGDVYELLRPMWGEPEDAVFTYSAKRTRDGRVKGERYPITAEGLHTVWHRYVAPKMTDFRFHDTRHTAATRMVRETGSLKLAQKLLGHSTVMTTARYAHVSHDDLRSALEAVSKSRNATQNATDDVPVEDKAFNDKGKMK